MSEQPTPETVVMNLKQDVERLEQHLLAAQSSNQQLTEDLERERQGSDNIKAQVDGLRESQDRALDSDSIVASCNCQTKTPEVEHHAIGCKYRLLSERDVLRVENQKLREECDSLQIMEGERDEAKAIAAKLNDIIDGYLAILGGRLDNDCARDSVEDACKAYVMAGDSIPESCNTEDYSLPYPVDPIVKENIHLHEKSRADDERQEHYVSRMRKQSIALEKLEATAYALGCRDSCMGWINERAEIALEERDQLRTQNSELLAGGVVLRGVLEIVERFLPSHGTHAEEYRDKVEAALATTSPGTPLIEAVRRAAEALDAARKMKPGYTRQCGDALAELEKFLP